MSYQRGGFGMGGQIPPGLKNLLFANGVVFIMQFLNYGLNNVLTDLFALHPVEVLHDFKIWQLVTYMFLHGGFWHVFFNMFVLWMLGMELEMEWGTKEFLKFYFICGVGAGLTNMLLAPASVTIGASGAVYGVMVAFALRYPDRPFYIYFLFPVKAKYLVGFLALVSLFSAFGTGGDGIAHAAHLGGMVVGFIYLKYWDQFYKLKTIFKGGSQKKSHLKYTSQADDEKTEYYRQKIDELLDKINRVGYLNLTDEEKELLEEGSRYLREHDKSDLN
jgi:membrane associated rhomboid family serine protease